MLDFVKSAFRGFFEAILWINLILCTILGGILGNTMRGAFRALMGAQGSGYGPLVVGAIIGLIVGFMMDVVGGGLVATLLHIDENLEQLKNNLKDNLSGLSSLPLSPGGKISAIVYEKFEQATHIVVQDTELYEKDRFLSKKLNQLHKDEYVRLIQIGREEMKIGQNAPMYFVENSKGEKGWAFSLDLQQE
jgi:hypothetical protein